MIPSVLGMSNDSVADSGASMTENVKKSTKSWRGTADIFLVDLIVFTVRWSSKNSFPKRAGG